MNLLTGASLLALAKSIYYLNRTFDWIEIGRLAMTVLFSGFVLP